MKIPVKIKSLVTGRMVEKVVSPRFLLDVLDEDDLISRLTDCGCQPIGETNTVECNCEEEWVDCEILIGEETKPEQWSK